MTGTFQLIPHGDRAEYEANGWTVTGNTPQQNVVRNVERRTYTVDDARAAMGMPWATIAGLSQAIPPAYSEFIGREAMKYIRREAAE